MSGILPSPCLYSGSNPALGRAGGAVPKQPLDSHSVLVNNIISIEHTTALRESCKKTRQLRTFLFYQAFINHTNSIPISQQCPVTLNTLSHCCAKSEHIHRGTVVGSCLRVFASRNMYSRTMPQLFHCRDEPDTYTDLRLCMYSYLPLFMQIIQCFTCINIFAHTYNHYAIATSVSCGSSTIHSAESARCAGL